LHWLDVPEAFEDDVENKLPILKEVKEKAIVNDDGKPTHILIEGDNYHALTCLNYTHKGKIDLIYIDPPYNTGKDGFKYKDKRILTNYPDGTEVPVDHPLRHSYWLSFMAKRLEIAKSLLTETGVILISIDDNEMAQLKLLSDEIFRSKNFVANFVWRGGKRNAAKYISISHEYLLMYSKNLKLVSGNDIDWKEQKPGLDDIYKILKNLRRKHKNDFAKITTLLKQWYKDLPDSHPSKLHKHYCNVDERGVYFASDISRGGGGGPRWKIINPISGNPVSIPSRGWAFSKKEDLLSAIENNLVHFAANDGVPCFKRYLKDKETQILDTVFYKDRRASSKYFRQIMGDGVFDFPKDVDIIAKFIKALTNENAIVLDFFAGSGTTLHSLINVNAEDDGQRQCIVNTNDEDGICSNICYPRIKNIINGYKNQKSDKMINGLGNSLKYYKTEFVGEHNILGANDSDKTELAHNAGEMLAIAENTLYEMEGYQTDFFQFFQNEKHYTAIYFREELKQFEKFRKKVMALEKPVSVYVFSWGENEFADQFDDRYDIEVKPIPQPILEVYKTIYNLSD